MHKGHVILRQIWRSPGWTCLVSRRHTRGEQRGLFQRSDDLHFPNVDSSSSPVSSLHQKCQPCRKTYLSCPASRCDLIVAVVSCHRTIRKCCIRNGTSGNADLWCVGDRKPLRTKLQFNTIANWNIPKDASISMPARGEMVHPLLIMGPTEAPCAITPAIFRQRIVASAIEKRAKSSSSTAPRTTAARYPVPARQPATR
jgi:hypothetical protein